MICKGTVLTMLVALTLAAAFARSTVPPVAALTGIVLPAGATATFNPILFSACNQITWGYQAQPGATVSEASFPGGCTTGTAPSVTIGPFATDVGLRVFISDVPSFGSGGTYYSDGDHALVTPLNGHIYTVAITDSGLFGQYVGQPRIPTPSDPGNLILTLTINSLNPTLTAQPTNNINVGAQIAFQGMQWNPTGAPITVSYDDHLHVQTIATLAATSAFQGQINHAEFAHTLALSKDLACTATLQAQQGSTTATVQLSSQVEAFLYGAAATRLAQPTGSFPAVSGPFPLCTGESANLNFDFYPVFMWTPQTQDAYRAVLSKLAAGLPGQFRPDVAYVEAQAGTAGQATVSVANGPEGLVLAQHQLLLANGASFCMATARGLASLTLPPAPNGSVGGACLSSLPHGAGVDLSGVCAAVGSAIQPLGSTLPNNTTLVGVHESSGNVTVDGNLHLNGAVICVKGDLQINGTVDGVGTFAVNGGTTVLGKFNLKAADTLILSAGGDVQLREGSRTANPFH